MKDTPKLEADHLVELHTNYLKEMNYSDKLAVGHALITARAIKDSYIADEERYPEYKHWTDTVSEIEALHNE